MIVTDMTKIGDPQVLFYEGKYYCYATHTDHFSTGEKAGKITKGDKVVVTAGVPLGVSGNTNMIRVVEYN